MYLLILFLKIHIRVPTAVSKHSFCSALDATFIVNVKLVLFSRILCIGNNVESNLIKQKQLKSLLRTTGSIAAKIRLNSIDVSTSPAEVTKSFMYDITSKNTKHIISAQEQAI